MQNTTSPNANQLPVQFSIGYLVTTPGTLTLLEKHRLAPLQLIARHIRGDWGNVPPEDAAANDAVTHGDRILSSYSLGDDDRVWVITEWDRSITTMLLPEEY